MRAERALDRLIWCPGRRSTALLFPPLAIYSVRLITLVLLSLITSSLLWLVHIAHAQHCTKFGRYLMARSRFISLSAGASPTMILSLPPRSPGARCARIRRRDSDAS